MLYTHINMYMYIYIHSFSPFPVILLLYSYHISSSAFMSHCDNHVSYYLVYELGDIHIVLTKLTSEVLNP